MEPSEKRELLEAHRFSSELDDKTATATAAVLDLRPTQPGDKPRVVVLRTGWAVCRFLKDVDTSAYDDMQVPPPPPSPAANWKRDVQHAHHRSLAVAFPVCDGELPAARCDAGVPLPSSECTAALDAQFAGHDAAATFTSCPAGCAADS
ncbi:hypothetical protein OsJ_16881 [Oryza sativa Japonica Group]|uniref:Uncharacterized protein n=1 Tax=Oryza sativa subsp. japonica TaxID=39947 RepID=B9FKB8_ORYSJ|nr:hypothetical protein OsJ_16881 [Oryza sativa Japonica Group]